MAAENILTVTKENYQELTQSGTPILLDFWAEWCGPCKMIAPVLDDLATEFEGRLRVGKVDVDREQDLAAQFRVSGIPSLFLVKNGQVVEQAVGAKGKRDLKAMIERGIA